MNNKLENVKYISKIYLTDKLTELKSNYSLDVFLSDTCRNTHFDINIIHYNYLMQFVFIVVRIDTYDFIKQYHAFIITFFLLYKL